MRKLDNIICPTCGISFKPRLSITKYCSNPCSAKSKPRGTESKLWKGGIHRRQEGAMRNQPSGYIEVWHEGKWIGQHRLKMELRLGRKLLHNEVVHHKNGIRNDNRVKNLVVLTNSAHNSVEKPSQVKSWLRNSKGQWTK